jgi:hypothetical protein
VLLEEVVFLESLRLGDSAMPMVLLMPMVSVMLLDLAAFLE